MTTASPPREFGLQPLRTCSQYNPATMRYCRRGITMVGPGPNGEIFYCDKHGLEKGARRIELIDAAQVEAEERAHDRIRPDEVLDGIGAVALYVEAFLAGVRYAALPREGDGTGETEART